MRDRKPAEVGVELGALKARGPGGSVDLGGARWRVAVVVACVPSVMRATAPSRVLLPPRRTSRGALRLGRDPGGAHALLAKQPFRLLVPCARALEPRLRARLCGSTTSGAVPVRGGAVLAGAVSTEAPSGAGTFEKRACRLTLVGTSSLSSRRIASTERTSESVRTETVTGRALLVNSRRTSASRFGSSPRNGPKFWRTSSTTAGKYASIKLRESPSQQQIMTDPAAGHIATVEPPPPPSTPSPTRPPQSRGDEREARAPRTREARCSKDERAERHV